MATALATFGIIGVGATELVMYPYWCIEKGYAKYTGPKTNDAAWYRRANGWIRVMKFDAFASMIIYTIATLAFFFMGVAVMYQNGLDPEGMRMVSTLQSLHQVVDTDEPVRFNQRSQPCFSEPALVRVEQVARAVLDETANPLEIVGAYRHPCHPSPARRLRIALPSRIGDSISSAIPARATEPGIPHTTLDSRSCTRTRPPASTMARLPASPSTPIPVSTTPSTESPRTAAADRKRTSAAGRQECSGSSRLS